MKQVVFIIALYVLINILSLLFNIFSFSSDGKIDIGLPFIFIHLTSAKYDSTFPYNKLLIEVKPVCADGTAMQCGRVGSRLLL